MNRLWISRRKFAFFACLVLVAAPLRAEDDAAKETLYRLAYKAKPGDVIYSRVTHLVTVETKIRGVDQTARTRSVSLKSWRMKSVGADGSLVFDHQVDHVDMWQTVTDGKEIKYNSDIDQLAPAGHEMVADSIGKTLATVTISPSGRILKRDNAQKHFNPGIGDLTVPLPETPVKVGGEWNIPDEVPLRLEDGSIKKFSVRQQYRLLKVETGVATITVETQVLTPVNDPKLQSQLVQRLQKGTIKFDIDAGKLISKQMDLDESVLGFNGAESHMQYQSRFQEDTVPAEEVVNRPSKKLQKPSVQTAPMPAVKQVGPPKTTSPTATAPPVRGPNGSVPKSR